MDIQALKDQVNLAVLVAQDLGQPKKHSGRWVFWSCPFHQDHDPSFGVTSDNGRWHCFGCGAAGDHLDWLERRRNLDTKQALQELARLAGSPGMAQPPEAAAPTSTTNDDPPNQTWQDRARVFASWAAEQLWTPAGQPGLDYLRGGGLTDDTIRAWRLGWCTKPYTDPGERWGLGGGKVWLPRGVVIPCEVAGAVWYVKIRCFDDLGQPVAEHGRKYSGPRGGRGALFGADRLQGDGRPLLMCEGERDALLAWQELAHLVDVVTLGGAGKRSLSRWALWLLPYRRIYAAFDADPAGQNGASWWAGLGARFKAATVPQGQDVTDYHAAGGDLQGWIRGVLDPEAARRLAEARQWAAEAQAEGLPCDGWASWPAWLAGVERELAPYR